MVVSAFIPNVTRTSPTELPPPMARCLLTESQNVKDSTQVITPSLYLLDFDVRAKLAYNVSGHWI